MQTFKQLQQLFWDLHFFPPLWYKNTWQAHQETIMLISQWFSGIWSLHNCVSVQTEAAPRPGVPDVISTSGIVFLQTLPEPLSVDRSCRPSHFSALCRPGRPAPPTVPSPSLMVISCLELFICVSPVNHAERPRQRDGTSSVRGSCLEGHVSVELGDDAADFKGTQSVKWLLLCFDCHVGS